MAPDTLPDPVAVAVAFSAALERLGIRYLIGGSFASSIHGEPRSTNDIDVVADVRLEHVPPFLEMLGQEYYVSADAMRDAVRSGGSFNVIHMHGGIKVDVFIAGRDAFDQERLLHRVPVQPSADALHTLYVATPEYSIRRKLEWFRRGGEFRVQDLDGDVAVVAEIAGDIHRGHAPGAEFALDVIAAFEGHVQAVGLLDQAGLGKD